MAVSLANLVTSQVGVNPGVRADQLWVKGWEGSREWVCPPTDVDHTVMFKQLNKIIKQYLDYLGNVKVST